MKLETAANDSTTHKIPIPARLVPQSFLHVFAEQSAFIVNVFLYGVFLTVRKIDSSLATLWVVVLSAIVTYCAYWFALTVVFRNSSALEADKRHLYEKALKNRQEVFYFALLLFLITLGL